jgi:hypothetical protein
MNLVTGTHGCAIAQAFSRPLPNAKARVRYHITSCGICGGQSGTGAGLLRVLRFPLPILIPPNAVYSSIIRGCYNRPFRGRRTKWTQSHPTPRNLKENSVRHAPRPTTMQLQPLLLLLDIFRLICNPKVLSKSMGCIHKARAEDMNGVQ